MKYFCLIVLLVTICAIQARSYFKRDDSDDNEETDHCANILEFQDIKNVFENVEDLETATQAQKNDWTDTIKDEIKCILQIIKKLENKEDIAGNEKKLHDSLEELVKTVPHADPEKESRFLGDCQDDYKNTDFTFMHPYQADGTARFKVWDCMGKLGADAIYLLKKLVEVEDTDTSLLKDLVQDVREMKTLGEFNYALETSIFENENRLKTNVYKIFHRIKSNQQAEQKNESNEQQTSGSSGGEGKRLVVSALTSNKEVPYLRKDNTALHRIAELLKKERHG